MTRTIALLVPLVFLVGCRATVSHVELMEALQASAGNSFPGQLVHEGASSRYDYYRIEYAVGAHQSYRVPLNDAIAWPEWSDHIGETCKREGHAVNYTAAGISGAPVTAPAGALPDALNVCTQLREPGQVIEEPHLDGGE